MPDSIADRQAIEKALTLRYRGAAERTTQPQQCVKDYAA